MTGCTRPVALVYIEDFADSSQEGREEFHVAFERILGGGYLTKGQQICLIHPCSKPHVVYAASAARRMQEIKEAYAKLGIPCIETHPFQTESCRSNLAGAFEIAKAWLAKPEFDTYRKLVIVWSDFTDETCATIESQRPFKDPLQFSWEPIDPEIHLYGLPAETHDVIKKAWKGLPGCHVPFETFEPQHLGLHVRVL